MFIEGRARLRLVLQVVDGRGLPHQFLAAMSELALAPVSAKAHLNPILAHLRLILSLVDSLLHLPFLCA